MTGFEITLAGLALAGAAACIAGIVNALAGGGTLITFPVLIATGVPEVAANVTNTVALCPGFLGGTLAQRNDLAGQRRRLLFLLPAATAGGIAGGILLLFLSEEVFHVIVPFLILISALVLAIQDRVRNWIDGRHGQAASGSDGTGLAILPMGFAGIYNGYFGAGGSVIILSVLGLFLDDTLTRLNALKQCISLFANVAAAIFFLFSGLIIWPVAVVMAAGALAGGWAGGRLAGRIDPDTLRWTVVVIGFAVGIAMLVQV